MTRARMRLRWRNDDLCFGDRVVGRIWGSIDGVVTGEIYSDGGWQDLPSQFASADAAKRAVRAFVVREMRAAVRGKR